MRALILAAGLGTRLLPLTNRIPKALVPVHGKSILVKQLENLRRSGINRIVVVVGYKADQIISMTDKYFPEVQVIENTAYENTNNMYSAWMARAAMEDDDFLMMNGDVFFDESILEGLMKDQAPNAIVTDIGKFYDESMKVVERQRKIVQISKEISRQDALGVSIDVYKFSAKAAKAFFSVCKKYIDEKKEKKLWSEVALNDILADVPFLACPVQGRWIEIDTKADLETAEAIFAE